MACLGRTGPCWAGRMRPAASGVEEKLGIIRICVDTLRSSEGRYLRNYFIVGQMGKNPTSILLILLAADSTDSQTPLI